MTCAGWIVWSVIFPTRRGLDSELVKEEEEPFDLLKMLGNLGQYLGEDAKSKGIDFIVDLPEGPITVQGLEARLAQVFVNLITNAISFCEDGDAIRVWARKRENRVLDRGRRHRSGYSRSGFVQDFQNVSIHSARMSILGTTPVLGWRFQNRLSKRMAA